MRVEPLELRHHFAAHVAGDPTVYATIQAAVNAAAPSAIIDVDAGTYSELVTVSKALTIRGAQAGVDARRNVRRNAAESIVNGATTSDGRTSGFYITANGVTIDGFTVEGNTSQVKYGAGIVIAPARSGPRILNNVIQNNIDGVYLANASATDAAIIQFNVFRNNNNAGENSGRGVYTDGEVAGGRLQNVTIDSNAFFGNRGGAGSTTFEAGIGFESRLTITDAQTNLCVTNNVFDSNGKSLLAYNASNMTISGNVSTHEVDQVSAAFRFEGGVRNVSFSGNTIYDSTGPAIRADAKAWGVSNSGFVVSNNNFYNNATAYGTRQSIVIGPDQYDGTFDARNNWWGSSSGPGGAGAGTGDLLTPNGNSVAFSPWLATPAVERRTPYSGAGASITSRIEAEDFDHGGEGVGYHDADAANSSGGYRVGEGVDLAATTDASGGFHVADARAGEWLNYTVDVPQAGTYALSLRVATSQTTGGAFYLEVDSQDVTGSLSVPGTGGAWQTMTRSGVGLTAGRHVLRLVFDAAGSSGTVGNFNWMQFQQQVVSPPPPPPPSGDAVYLSDLPWTSATNGWGPVELDQSNGGSDPGDGNSITLNGVVYPKGLGVHAASEVIYALGGAYRAFQSDLGVDDEEGVDGSVTFQVFADGVKIYDSGILAGSSPTATASLDLTGVNQLRLVVTDGGDGSDFDHADWAGARLIKAPVVQPPSLAAPSGLAATASSATLVKLTWVDNSAGEAGYKIERSSDGGVNFTQVGTAAAEATSYGDATVKASTAYVYRVRAAGAGVNDSGYSNTASVTTPASPSSSFAYLSDLTWASAVNGWGPVEKDSSNGSSGAGDGKFMTLNGTTYAKGLGVHAASQIIYTLNGLYSQFVSDIGVDDESTAGTVVFQVYVDNVKVFDSGLMTATSATKSVNLSVPGAQQLKLIVTDGGDGNSFDKSDWAAARLVYAGPAPAAPTGLSATLATGGGAVRLAWTDNATSETGYRVERSTDGVSYTAIATLAANSASYTDAAVSAGASYTYRVVAISGNGASTSNTASIAVPAPAPTAPGNLAVAVAYSTMSLTWGAAGGTVQGYYVERSPDGVNFTRAATLGVVTSYTDASAVAGQNYTYRVQAFNSSGVSGYSNAASALIPSTALPTGWTNQDIGSTGVAGSATQTNGVFTVKGSGAQISGLTDSFQYAYRAATGDMTVVARVLSMDNTSADAMAGIMIRESSATYSKMVGVFLTPKNGVRFARRLSTAGDVAKTDVKGATAPQWVKLTRKGSTFTAYRSNDGVNWSQIGSVTCVMNTSVYVGLAVTSHKTGTLNTAKFDNVSVVQGVL